MNTCNLLPLLLVGPALAQGPSIPEIISRPATENRFAPSTSDISGESIQGGIFLNPGDAPNSSGIHLTEASFGHAFANYATPYATYATDILAPIWSNLYPAGYPATISQTRTAIKDGGKPFRYKYLLHGTDEGSIAILDLNDAANDPGLLFGEAERTTVAEEIKKLRLAIAQDPLNTDLQDALLETYHDWAVGESQVSKKVLHQLSQVRLGLISGATPFIIDYEIETYETLVANSERILEVYKELLSLRLDGINPGDFDPGAGNAPFGYYLFKARVPHRNPVASQYAPEDGTAVVDVLASDPPPASGYKDYRTLLTFLGQYIEYQAELARFRGMRKANGDLTAARNGLTEVQHQAGLAGLLAGMFTNPDGSPIDFNAPSLDTSGIRAAKIYVETALADAADSRSYLNGESNHLGIDPNFLILLRTNDSITPAVGGLATGVFDTYDILSERLTERTAGSNDPVGPLAIAKDALDAAKEAFEDFKANVDNIGTQLDDIETDFNDDFLRLTGFEGDEAGNFTGQPNVIGESDLKSANTRIADLARRNLDIIAINKQIDFELAQAKEAVTLAEGIEEKITGAAATYLNDTAAAWTEIHVWAGTAAGAASAYQTLADVAGADISSKPLLGAVIASGVLNTAIQTAAAIRTSMREQEIEEAAIALEISLATADLELGVKQAAMVVSSLYRDLLSGVLEINDNNAALAQAIAEHTAILRECQILQRNLQSDFTSLATSYFADPIFYIRAEREVLRADAAFREAQRWMFYTCRALEYKWQQPFARDNFDISSILSARNYDELEEIRTKMALFNGTRRNGQEHQDASTTLISLRDQFITPNPNDPDLTFNTDIPESGERYSSSQGRMITQVEHFREILKRDHIDDSGNLVIDFNTSILNKNFNGGFFRGPNFSGNPQSGNYRNKIIWTAVHIHTNDPEASPSPDPAERFGSLSYGGLTYFRTRVPVDPVTRQSASNTFNPAFDYPGAYVSAPVRYYQDTELNGRYTFFDSVLDEINIAESTTSARNSTSPSRVAIEGNTEGLRSGALKERAVAATRFSLQINGLNRAATEARIDLMEDIEILVRHQSYPRARISE